MNNYTLLSKIGMFKEIKLTIQYIKLNSQVLLQARQSVSKEQEK